LRRATFDGGGVVKAAAPEKTLCSAALGALDVFILHGIGVLHGSRLGIR